MKAIILIFVAALRLTVGADEPETLSAVQARAIYEKSIAMADTARAEAVQAAKDDALTELASALETSVKNKNRKEANVIATAIKSLTEKSVLEAGLLPAVDTIKEGYEASIESARKQYAEQISPAQIKYLAALEAALETAMDAAFVAKDLEEVNRIDAAMEPLRAEADRLEADRVGSLPPFKNTIGMSFKQLYGGPGGDFSIGVHEVTQQQYESVMGDNPSSIKGANSPVETVSWHDAVAFCAKLSSLPAEVAAGREYRLPTEAEWEYACRAGTTTAYSFGDDAQDLGNYAWFSANSESTHAVGEKLPNGWGLYDMYGNVWEWCSDAEGSDRVIRGGSWDFVAAFCRSAFRLRSDRASRSNYVGFRLALSSPSVESPEAEQDK